MTTCFICGRPARYVKRDVLETARPEHERRTIITTTDYFCDQHAKQALRTLHCEVCARPARAMERSLIEVEPVDGYRKFEHGAIHVYCRRHTPKSKFNGRLWWFRHVEAPLHIAWLKLTGRVKI